MLLLRVVLYMCIIQCSQLMQQISRGYYSQQNKKKSSFFEEKKIVVYLVSEEKALEVRVAS